MASPVYVIEHLDEEFFDWSQMEYKRIAETIYPCQLMITNFHFDLLEYWDETARRNVICTKQSITELGISTGKICLMDSEAKEELCPADGQLFSHILLGGILGNVDEFDMDKTAVLRKEGFPTRHLGSMQMSTDTAAIVAHRILTTGAELAEIPFLDRPEIEMNECERVIMNFRYVKGADGQPEMAPGVLALIKNVELELDLLE